MKLRLIPPGEFMMGSTPAEIEKTLHIVGEQLDLRACIKSEAPQHKVILTRPFYLGVHEVTQAEYEQVMGKNPSWLAKTGPEKEWSDKAAALDTSRYPVESLNWIDAVEFCAKLSAREKRQPCYVRKGETVTVLEGTGYRLPTEAQWEFACRAGTTTKCWLGETEQDFLEVAWLGSNADGRPHEVGGLKANPFGLHDLHGNVWEWVQDAWEPTYYEQFREQPALDPSGPPLTILQRVMRGGCWYDYSPDTSRVSSRYAAEPPHAYFDVRLGFRLALEINDPRTR